MANAAVAVEAGPSKIIKALHEDCSKVVTASCDAKYTQLNAASYGLANDLDIWIKVLATEANVDKRGRYTDAAIARQMSLVRATGPEKSAQVAASVGSKLGDLYAAGFKRGA